MIDLDDISLMLHSWQEVTKQCPKIPKITADGFHMLIMLYSSLLLMLVVTGSESYKIQAVGPSCHPRLMSENGPRMSMFPTPGITARKSRLDAVLVWRAVFQLRMLAYWGYTHHHPCSKCVPSDSLSMAAATSFLIRHQHH